MYKFNEIVSKRIKLRPWLIVGCVFMICSVLECLIAIPFMMKYNCLFIVIMTCFLFVALGIAPFFYAEHLDNKAYRFVDEYIQSKLFNMLEKDKRINDISLEIKRLQGIAYTLVIVTQTIPIDYLEEIVKDIIEDMYKKTPYKLRINPSIGKRLSI